MTCRQHVRYQSAITSLFSPMCPSKQGNDFRCIASSKCNSPPAETTRAIPAGRLAKKPSATQLQGRGAYGGQLCSCVLVHSPGRSASLRVPPCEATPLSSLARRLCASRHGTAIRRRWGVLLCRLCTLPAPPALRPACARAPGDGGRFEATSSTTDPSCAWPTHWQHYEGSSRGPP